MSLNTSRRQRNHQRKCTTTANTLNFTRKNLTPQDRVGSTLLGAKHGIGSERSEILKRCAQKVENDVTRMWRSENFGLCHRDATQVCEKTPELNFCTFYGSPRTCKAHQYPRVHARSQLYYYRNEVENWVKWG